MSENVALFSLSAGSGRVAVVKVTFSMLRVIASAARRRVCLHGAILRPPPQDMAMAGRLVPHRSMFIQTKDTPNPDRCVCVCVCVYVPDDVIAAIGVVPQCVPWISCVLRCCRCRRRLSKSSHHQSTSRTHVCVPTVYILAPFQHDGMCLCVCVCVRAFICVSYDSSATVCCCFNAPRRLAVSHV